MAICNCSDRLTATWFLSEAEFDLNIAAEHYMLNNIHDEGMEHTDEFHFDHGLMNSDQVPHYNPIP